MAGMAKQLLATAATSAAVSFSPAHKCPPDKVGRQLPFSPTATKKQREAGSIGQMCNLRIGSVQIDPCGTGSVAEDGERRGGGGETTWLSRAISC